MTNIKRFNDCTAKLLAFLYEHFPYKVDLDFYEWLGKDVFEAGDDDLEFCYATLEWLAEAGYVAVGTLHNSGAAKVTLTPKALEVLKVVPESLTAKRSIGDLLVEKVGEGALSAAGQLVSAAFTEGFKLMVKNV